MLYERCVATTKKTLLKRPKKKSRNILWKKEIISRKIWTIVNQNKKSERREKGK